MNSAVSMAAKVVILWVSFVCSTVVQAAYTRTAVPQGVSMSAGGTVVVQALGGLSWAYLCNVETPQNGVSVAACRALHASLLVAQSTGQPMTLWFDNTAGTCAANAPWQFAPGLYFWRTGG